MKIRTYTEQGVTFTEVINDKNLKVVFSNLGAAIFSIRFDNYVMTRNVKEISDFLIEKKYYGKTIGRVSNRMKGNKFRLNDEVFEVPANEGENTLHGGHNGVSTLFFDFINVGHAPFLINSIFPFIKSIIDKSMVA